MLSLSIASIWSKSQGGKERAVLFSRFLTSISIFSSGLLCSMDSISICRLFPHSILPHSHPPLLPWYYIKTHSWPDNTIMHISNHILALKASQDQKGKASAWCCLLAICHLHFCLLLFSFWKNDSLNPPFPEVCSSWGTVSSPALASVGPHDKASIHVTEAPCRWRVSFNLLLSKFSLYLDYSYDECILLLQFAELGRCAD